MAKKYGSIQLISKLHSVLSGTNKVYLDGQSIYATMDTGRIGLKRGDGVTAYLALEWVVDPASSTPYPPFKVRNTDPSYAQDGDDVVITDARLLGQEDYVITNNQYNVEFRAGDLVFDAGAGSVRIKNFFLDAANNITIYPTWGTGTTGGVDARVTELEKICKVFSMGVSSGMVFWNRPAIDIPPGWQEVTDFRGKTVFGYHPANANFDAIGKVGGVESKILNAADMPNIPFNYDGVDPSITYKRGTTGTAFLSPTVANKAGVIPGANNPIPILNPYRTVLFIEYLG